MACYPGQPGALQQPLAEHGAPGVAAAMDLHDDADPCDFELDDPGSLKPHSTQSTIKWLEGNYHYEEGICLPRSTIYEHYLDFCQREQLQPVNAASFGKIIRQQFPTLTTRRLGTRGQSKYHYYGLGIKPTSRYYTQEYIQKQQNPGTTRKEPEAKKPHAYYASKDKPSAVLPPFPDVSSLDLSDSVPKEKLHTFMVMYRAHCQRVLDSIVRATFDEVENFLLHFWQGMPNHLLPVLGSDTVIDLVAICDSTLYKAVSNVFISSPLQMIPENVAQEVQRFSTNLKPWLDSALKGLPDSLRTVKRSVADVFSQSLQRQKSLMHLADAARNALRSEEVLIQMSDDWAAIDVETIIAQTLYAIQPLDVPQQYMNMIPQFLDGFSRLLSEEKSSVEDFAVWVDNIIDKCFKKCKASKSVKDIGKIFLLTWKFFTSKIIREFTLTSAPSFGTFHLLHMLIDDYISHCLETLVEDEAHRTHFTNINLPTPESSVDEEKVLTLEAAEPTTAISEMALPSEPAPDFPLVAQAPASFTLPPSTNLTSAAQHGRISSDGGELNLHPPPPPPPSQEFPSSLDHGIAEGTSGVGSLRESVLPESGSLSAHLSSTAGLNSSQSTARGNLGSLGPLPPPPIGAGLSLSSRSTSTNPLSSATNPLSSFVPNPTTLSSLTSIGGSISGGGSLLPSGLRLPDSTASSLSQHAHPPQLPPLPSHLSSLSFVNPFAQLQSSSLGMGVGASQQQQQHSRGQSQSQIGQNLSSITSAPSSQHLQQPPHNIQAPNVAAAPSGQQQGPSLQTLTTSAANLSSGGMPPMPLSHNMAAVAAAGGTTGGLPGSLSNPSALPLLPGMHNMYPYPYTGALPSAAAAVQSLPSQPITSAMVRMNTPAFPSQTLVPGYPSYVAPSLYGNAQPPVTNGNFTR